MPIPGTYYGNVTSAVLKTAQTGTVYFEVTFDVTHRAENGQWVPEQCKAWVKFFFTDKTEERAMKELEILGFNGAFGGPAFTKPAQTLIFEKDGKFDKWSLAAASGGTQEAAGNDVIARFNARWAAKHPKPAAVGVGGNVPQPSALAQPGGQQQAAPAPAPSAESPAPTSASAPAAPATAQDPPPTTDIHAVLPGVDDDVPF